MDKIYSLICFLILTFEVIICEPRIFNKIVDKMIKFDGMAFPKSVFSSLDAMQYLNRFGYMKSSDMINMDMSTPKMKSVIMDYQRFMGINESGALDKETMDMMNMPRCGVADNIRTNTLRKYGMNFGKRFKRYTLQGSVWDTKDLTWRMTSYSRSDTLRGRHEDIERIMDYALNEWAQNSGLSFTKDTSGRKASIEIGFEVMDHNDGNPFDGPGRTLAHAFFPQFGGKTHFDDSEKWSIDGKQGVDLLSVAVHEFGHALGLGHSDNKDSLMYPTYAGKRYKLKKDDINGIEMLYGKRERRDTSHLDTNERKIPNMRSSAPDLCTDFRLDAADCNEMDECFFFRDEYVWRVNGDTGVHFGYPKLISHIFPEFSGKIDSVFTEENGGRTFIFRKDKVWVYKEPMTRPIRANDSIANIFRGLNANYLDASTRWGHNGKTYLFRKDKYWKYESEKVTVPISHKYPKSIKLWRGLPETIDAAMFWPKTGKTYFFVGSKYYRFNDISDSVDRANPPFPRDASKWWLKCKQRRRGKSINNEINDSKCADKDCSNNINESNDPSSHGFFKTIASGFDIIPTLPQKFFDLFKI